MMRWKTTLRFTPQEVMLLVTRDGDDVLKARLPLIAFAPGHPRALLTLLEGLALWAGAPLSAVISAEDGAETTLESALYGDGVWPPFESPLVFFEFADVPARGPRPQRISGVGDFRRLRHQ